LGPSLALLVEPDWGSAGVLLQNIWSVAGHSIRSPVNQLQLQPMFSYSLPRGWYLTSQPMIISDWTQPTHERWLLPIGGGAGRVCHVGKQAIDLNIAVYWNAVRSTHLPSSTWQLSVQFTLLFAKNASKTP